MKPRHVILVTYPFNGTYCSWCGVGECAMILTTMRTSSISNKSVYDPPCLNTCFMNSFWRSFVCSLIAITYIELHTPLMGHVLVGVVEVDGS